MKAKAILLWPEASHLFKTELLSISVGLWMYARASPFSLALAMLVRDQVLSLLSDLKERSHAQEPTGRVNRSCKMVDMFEYNFSLQWLTACCNNWICLASELLPYISWFYLNQSNFFYELFSQLTLLKKKSENQDKASASSCLMLATALFLCECFAALLCTCV